MHALRHRTTEAILQRIDYRGYRLSEIRRYIVANPHDVIQVRWLITQWSDGVEKIIGEALSLGDARAKVDDVISRAGGN